MVHCSDSTLIYPVKTLKQCFRELNLYLWHDRQVVFASKYVGLLKKKRPRLKRLLLSSQRSNGPTFWHIDLGVRGINAKL